MSPKKTTALRLAKYEAKYAKHQSELMATPLFMEVLNTGYFVIPNFWNARQCENARKTIDYLLQPESNKNVKVWSDVLGADTRIMGANNLASELNLFSDVGISNTIHALYGVNTLSGFSMAARLKSVNDNLGSGQGWHRDSCVEHQYKAILYLSNVDSDTGPFQYYRHSGNSINIMEFEERTGIDVDENRLDIYEHRFEHEQIDELSGSEGTLIIANTRGIHRGKPIHQGSRYSLTNYYWKEQIPAHITPYLNFKNENRSKISKY